MWVNFNNEISRDYGRKFRQLQASLRNDENDILRQQLLNGEIEPVSVTSLTQEHLAPKSRQEQNELIKKKHFEQKIKINGESESSGGLLVVKTSQGLEYI